MAHGSTARLVGLGRNDPLFARIRIEAEEAARSDPALASFLMTAILNHDTLEGGGRPSRRRAARSRRRAERADPPGL